jgi:putative ABC transport system substrate-binding protein
MRRRDFIKVVPGSAIAWPFAVRAQQQDRMRRVGVLLPTATDNAVFQARMAAFLGGLQQLGWTDGRNVRIDTRWYAGDTDLIRKYAVELVALGPDVVMAFGSNAVPPLQQVTRTIPIVFALVADPVGAGYVESLAQPGGNVTGFTTFEYAIGGKWLELVKEIAPRTTRVAVLRDSAIAAGPAEFGAIQALAPSLGVELRPVDMRDAGEIERAIHGVRGEFQRWPDNNCKQHGDDSSRADHCARGAAPITRCLLFPLLRHWRRLDFLWA